MLAEIQVLPTPGGSPERRWAHVEAAIAVLAASGLRHEVGALGTTVEGPADAVWAALRAAHDAALAAGAQQVFTVIKLLDGAGVPSIAALTGPHRPER